MPPLSVGSAIVLGAGPAGCSCASWLAQQGVSTVLLDAAPVPCPLLVRLDLRQDWVLGFPGTSTAELAARFEQHLRTLPRLQLRCGVRPVEAVALSRSRKSLRLSDGSTVEGAALVVATGLRPRRHPWPQEAGQEVLDAVALTPRRSGMRRRRVLLLGGGDNAAENALYLAGRDNQVVLWSRGPLRAQPLLQAQLAAAPQVQQRIGEPMPSRVRRAAGGWAVESAARGAEAFDEVAALFGFEPEDGAWELLRGSAAWRAAGWPDLPMDRAEQIRAEGIFVAGDASGRLHPSIQTALADGVTVSREIIRWLP